MRKIALCILFLLFLIIPSSAVVVRVDVKGEINQGTVELINYAFEKAEKLNAKAVLITIDTPGGLLQSTKDIVSKILNSDIPVITYVYPRGAFSASAGSFILLAGHISAMANGTSVGSATPIVYGGYESKEAKNKTINYIASYIESIAEERGKPKEIVRKFVTEGISLTAKEAYEKGVIDVLADSIPELFEKIDGKNVVVKGKNVTLKLKNEEIVTVEKPVKAKILEILTNPQIAFILFLVGIYTLVFGLTSPGIGAEVVGAICLILALIGLGVLAIDYVGMILILLGIILLVVELLNPTHGVLGVASVVCIALGSLMLFKEPLMPKGFYEGFKFFVVGISLGFASFMTFAIIKVAQMRRMKVKVGKLEGEVGEVMEFKDGEGLVKVRGEIWKCISDEELKVGDKVTVVGREGLTLKVKRL